MLWPFHFVKLKRYYWKFLIIAPVGEAYRILKNEFPHEFGLLYKKDGSHPSSDLGRYLGACVHYSTLFGKTLPWKLISQWIE